MKKKTNKRLLWLTLTIVFGFLFYLGIWLIAPGSYSRAETYEFNIKEDSLIALIEEFKSENPELTLKQNVNISNNEQFNLVDGRSDSTDYWYSIYFYYPDKNEILHTWTRPKDRNRTTFAFVGINDGLTLGNWRTVNNSFWWWKNQPDIEEFESRILNRIKEKIKTKHNKG
jgi:hypothetical protein